MADSSSISPNCLHLPARAISLPSREHPISLKFDAILNHLKTWQTSSASSHTAPFGAENIRIGLVGVAELYNCVDEIILTPHAQQAILRHQSGKLVEEFLDASVTLLDTSSTVKDILLMMKELVLALQSAFRRRGRNSSIESNVHAYISSRRNTQKGILKCLRTLKKFEDRIGLITVFDSDLHLSMVVRVIREATTITISIFRSLLLLLSMPAKKKFDGCSLVFKLMSLRSSSSDHQAKKITNEAKSLDFCIFDIEEQLRSKDVKADQVQKTQKMLETLNLSLDSLDSELECMSKCLVQNRVCLLNILTH